VGFPIPPPGTSVDAGPSIFTNPPQEPGVITTPPLVTAPAVPLTTVAATNTSGVDVMVYLLAGSGASATVIKVNGAVTGLTLASAGTSATVYLPAGESISMTYSGGTLTWVWQAI
jgi:uncharacterized protein RhaS with RHS repeats